MKKILILGSSGTVGTPLAQLLQAKGETVAKATSRRELAADQVHLDLVTKEGLATAFAGVDRTFLLSPPGFTRQDELLIPVIDAAKKNGVKKIVLMTAMGVNFVPESPLAKVEAHLRNSGVDYNIIRPNWFMQNFNTFWIQGILSERKIYLPVAKAKGSFIDARDIAAVAAELLTSERFQNQEFDLTGEKAIDHDEVARLLSRETEVDISYQEITPAQMLDGLLTAGLPPDYAQFLLVILQAFKEGHAERISDAVRKITGRPALTFEQYARDYRKSWLK